MYFISIHKFTCLFIIKVSAKFIYSHLYLNTNHYSNFYLLKILTSDLRPPDILVTEPLAFPVLNGLYLT